MRSSDGAFVDALAVEQPPRDHDYIEGALEFVVNGTEVVGKEDWDYVDTLWCYIATMVDDFRSTDVVHSYFPDMPVKLQFRRRGHLVLVSRESRTASVQAVIDRSELLTGLEEEGRRFLQQMSVLSPDNAEAYEVAIEQLTGRGRCST